MDERRTRRDNPKEGAGRHASMLEDLAQGTHTCCWPGRRIDRDWVVQTPNKSH